MRYGYAYISAGIAIVGISIFAFYYFSTYHPTQIENSGTPCTDQQKAIELAENSIGQENLLAEGYRPDGVSCVYLAGANGIPAVFLVKVSFSSDKESAGELVVTEDSTLTKVINGTVIPKLRLGSTG